MRDYKAELQEDLEYGRKNGYQVVLVEANPEKGFNYSYFVYIPKKPQSTFMIDCLNDYEDALSDGQMENLEGVEEIYSLFEPSEIIRNNNDSTLTGNEEPKDQTLYRMYYRLEKGIVALINSIGINPNIPTIVPLIPGYDDEEFDRVVSQLDKDVIRQTAPQIKAMIEDARGIVEDRTGIKMNDKVVLLGHSKSSTFANNFSSYYPELCDASILGGGDFGTLPIDEIALQIVDDDKISDSEEFQIINGKVTKKITQTDFDRIVQEYNSNKRDYQAEITVNADGTYNLPMNFPIGIADIENYRDLSDFPGGKEGYRQSLMSMPKMIFVGEHEDTRPGHYAYSDGKTAEGIDVRAGEDISAKAAKLGRSIYEVEVASMHNRVLEYISASNTLFGKSINERLGSYMQLYNILNMPVQSKIYKGVGHCDYRYSDIAEGLDGVSSEYIYVSKTVKNDIVSYYEGIVSGTDYQLDDTDRAERISPIPQLVRRYLASGRDTGFLAGISDKKMMKALQKYIGKHDKFAGKNIDRIYDNISPEELELVYRMAKKEKGKKGFSDCLEDDKVRISTEQDAIRVVEGAIRDKDNVIDTTGQQK